MDKKTTTLPGIRDIFFVDSSLLDPSMEYRDEVGIPISVNTDVTRVRFFGNPSCESIRMRTNGGYTEKTTLKFNSDAVLPEFKHLAFIVRDMKGRFYCIGTRERPYTVVKRTRSITAPSSEPTVFTYTVTRNSVRSFLECQVIC